MFGKKKEKAEQNIEENNINEEAQELHVDKSASLYILIDKATNKFKKYIEDCGINATYVYDSIDAARDELFLEYDGYRLAIIDTGTGKFSGVAQRKDLIDLLGIMDDECKASLFYTDDALRQEVKHSTSKMNKDITIQKYRGTTDVVIELMKLGEKYSGSYKADVSETSDERGATVVQADGTEKFMYRHPLDDIKEMCDGIANSEYGEVKSYEDHF